MRRILISVLIVLCSFFCAAQSHLPYFNKTIDNSGILSSSIVQLNDGYFLLGDLLYPKNRGVYYAKLNFLGDTIWNKKLGIINGAIGSYKALKTTDGNIVFIAAITDSIDSISGKEAQYDIMLFKINPITGDSIWQKRYYMPGYDYSRDIVVNADNGFAIVASSDSYVSADPGDIADVLLIKTDSLGNIKWQKKYGGIGYDEIYSINKTNDKGYVFSGFSNSFDSNYGIYVVRVDSFGDILWQKTFGLNNSVDAGLTTQLRDGNFITVSGYENGNIVMRLTKIDGQTGKTIWDKEFPYLDKIYCNAKPLENIDGTITLASSYYPSNAPHYLGFLLKLTALGDTIWSRRYVALSTYLQDIHHTDDGGFVFCGSGFISGHSIASPYVVKTDCMGNDSINYPAQNTCCHLYAATVQSNKQANTFCKGDSIILSISPALTAYNWSNGSTTQSVTLKDSGSYTVTVTGNSGCTLVLPLRVNMDTLPKPSISRNDSILTSNYSYGNQWYKDGVAIIGSVMATYNTKHIPGTYTVLVKNTCGSEFALGITILGVHDPIPLYSEGLLIAVPNPFSEVTALHYQLNKPAANTKVLVFDVTGRKVLEKHFDSKQNGQVEFDATQLGSGLYMCQLWAENKLITVTKVSVIK